MRAFQVRSRVVLAAIAASFAMSSCNLVLGVGDFQPGVCDEGAKQCAGNTPQTCEAGQWQSVTPCKASSCLDGSCMGACETGDERCSDNTPQTCNAGSWEGATPCDPGQPARAACAW